MTRVTRWVNPPGHRLRIAQPMTWPATVRAGYGFLARPAGSAESAGLGGPVTGRAGPKDSPCPLLLPTILNWMAKIEALNKCLEIYLRCFSSEHHGNWVGLLSSAEYWYNTAYQTSIGMTIFRIVYGRDPPGLLSYTESPEDPPLVSQWLIDRDKFCLN